VKFIAQFTLIIGLLLTGTSCLKQEVKKSSGASAPFNAETTPVRWNPSSLGANGLNLRISSDLADDFVAGDLDGSGHNPVEQMLKAWNGASSSLTFFKISPTATANKDTGNLNSYNDSEFGIYKSYGWLQGVSNQALAVTQYYGQRRNIGAANEYVELIHADIILNYRDYTFSTDSSSTTTYDLHSVLLHEMGHFLGLSHVTSFSTASVMQPYLGLFDSQRTLTAYDSSKIRSLYGVSGLSAGGGNFIVGASVNGNNGDKVLPKAAKELKDGTVHGLIELRADGECVHRENGKVIHRH